MRTFVLNDRGRYKFWNVQLQGSNVVLSFGQVGRDGRSETRSFASPEEACQQCDKLIDEQTAKGYVETTVPDQPTPPPPASLRDTLERAILDDPADLASHAAYADWLGEQSAPADLARSELIRIQLKQEDDSISSAERLSLHARERSLVKKHQREWVGPWVDRVIYEGPEGRGQLHFAEPRPVRYVRGLPAEAVIGQASLRCAAAFVTCPESWLVRKLFVGGFPYEEPDPEPGEELIPTSLTHLETLEISAAVHEALKTWPGLANLRAFQLGWTSNEEYGERCNFQCHESGRKVHELVAKMPRLEELYLFLHRVNNGVLFSLPMPHLRVLQIYHSLDYPLEKLAENATLTKLTHLLFHPHAFENEVSLTLNGLKAIARSPHLKSLTHLRLRLTTFGDEGIQEIIDSGLIERLKVLDLRHGRVTSEGAWLLAAHPATKKLQLLDLSRNELGTSEIAALQATGVPLNSQHQHESTEDLEPDEYGDMEHLFEGDYE
jgi:uncharacterized protein (TIGR02996 family)